MNRSGYVDQMDDVLAYGRWRGQVTRSIRGKRGQAFLRELAAEMDAMPEKVLITEELINADGDCCTIGVVCKARGVDVANVDPEDARQVADLVDISHQMAAEIEYENDEGMCDETPEHRWERMRRWVEKKIQTKSS